MLSQVPYFEDYKMQKSDKPIDLPSYYFSAKGHKQGVPVCQA